LAGDVGVFHWNSATMRVFLADLIAVGKPPANWKDEDVGKIAGAICRVGGTDWPWDLKKKGGAAVEAAISRWPSGARRRVAPAAVAEWKKLDYRHQRDVALKLLERLGGAEVEKLKAEFAAASKQLEKLKAELAAKARDRAFREMTEILERIAPLQRLVLDYDLDENRLRPVKHHLKLCLGLEKEWADEARRLEAVKKAIESLLEKPGFGSLANNTHKPRFPEELAVHFLPQLKKTERAAVERLLIARGRRLDPKRHWQESLLLAELLTGVAGDAARAFLPRLVERRRKAGAPRWQLDYLEKFARASRAK
jgi:hypothetical protein